MIWPAETTRGYKIEHKMASRGYKIEHNMASKWQRISMGCFLEGIKADEVPMQPLPWPLIAWPDLADLNKYMMSEWDKYMNIDVVS